MSGRGGSVVFSWGTWGGFYVFRGYSTRLCLGWLAITFIPCDIDALLEEMERQWAWAELHPESEQEGA